MSSISSRYISSECPQVRAYEECGSTPKFGSQEYRILGGGGGGEGEAIIANTV